MRTLAEQLTFVQNADNGFLLLFLLCFAAFLLSLYIDKFYNSLDIPSFSILPAIPIWLIVLCAVLLRLPGLFASLWYDEAFTAALAGLPMSQAWQMLIADVHPILAYLPYWIVSHLMGDASYLLRLPSLLAGLAIVYVLYRLGKEWGEDSAKAAAFFGAFMPSFIWYSTEARAYSFLCLAVLVAILAIRENRRYVFIFALGVLPLLHAYGFLYAGIIGLYAFVVPFTNSIASVTAIRIKDVLIAAIPGVIWLPFMALQSADISNGFWIYPPTLGTFFKVFIANTITLAYPPFLAMLLIPLTLWGIFQALNHPLNRDSEMSLYWFVLLGAPIAAFVLSWLWHPILLDRALLPSVSVLIIFLARSYASKNNRAFAIVLALAIAIPFQMINKGAQKYEFANIVGHCESHPIYTLSAAAAIVADYYSEQPISIYPHWNNLNQELPFEVIDSLGYIQQAIPAQNACIYWQESPQTALGQIHAFERFKDILSLSCTRYIDNPSFVVEICLND